MADKTYVKPDHGLPGSIWHLIAETIVVERGPVPPLHPGETTTDRYTTSVIKTVCGRFFAEPFATRDDTEGYLFADGLCSNCVRNGENHDR